MKSVLQPLTGDNTGNLDYVLSTELKYCEDQHWQSFDKYAEVKT